MSACNCPLKNGALRVNATLAAVDTRSGYRFQNPSSPTRYGSAPKAHNFGGELINQAAFS